MTAARGSHELPTKPPKPRMRTVSCTLHPHYNHARDRQGQAGTGRDTGLFACNRPRRVAADDHRTGRERLVLLGVPTNFPRRRPPTSHAGRPDRTAVA